MIVEEIYVYLNIFNMFRHPFAHDKERRDQISRGIHASARFKLRSQNME